VECVKATSEPVSAKTQPVSDRVHSEISDIGNSSSGDSAQKYRAPVRTVGSSSPETGFAAANLRKCRHYSQRRKSVVRDRGGWLGRQDSNQGMAESKSVAAAERGRLFEICYLYEVWTLQAKL
jgi:hypothetical protein